MSETPLELNWESVENSRVRAPRHVVHRSFASETVLLNVETGHYYGMDEIGSRFFDVLCESPDVRSAVAVLAEEFEGSVERIRHDMVKFCTELLSLGLIELKESGEGTRPVRHIRGSR